MIGLVRVLVADDHEMMREAIVNRLEREAGFEVVGAVGDAKTLMYEYVESRPDVVVTDQYLGELTGAEACETIRRVDPDAKILIFSAFERRDEVAAAVASGAMGFVAKTVSGDALCDAIRRAAQGDPVFGAEATRLLMAEIRNPAHGEGAPGVLSDREAEVLRLVADGFTNRQIAERLYLSANTIKSHVERIASKLGVKSRAAAVRRGVEVGAI